MKRRLLLVASLALIVCAFSATAFAQGRGRGVGLGRRSDVFSDRGFGAQGINRGRNQDWKCGVFVNCHDARNGRLDGRGPRFRTNRNGIFVPRRLRVRNRFRNSDRDAIRQARLNRLEMLRQERIAERRDFRRRRALGRP